MKKPSQSVPQLLEQYVFMVAAQFIEQLEKPEQDQLIQFIVKLDPEPVGQISLCVDQPTKRKLFVDPESGEPAFEAQEGSGDAQTESTNREDKYPYPIHRLIASQQTHIDSAIINIARIAVLIERTQAMLTRDSARQTILLDRYNSLKDSYIAYLMRMQAFQQQQQQKMTQYHKQPA